MTDTTTAVRSGDRATITPRNRQSLWRTSGAEIIALLVFVLGSQLLLRAVDIEPEGGSAIAVGLLLAGIPALLWMAFFFAQDRAEPEPLHAVALVGGVAGLLCVAVGQPLITKAYGVGSWMGRSTLTQIAASVLIVGFVQEACKLAAVRATVYDGDAINQRVDGVVYGAAAGVGYATALNVATVLGAGGFVDIRAGVIRIVTTALTHGALGALVGYALGRNRIDARPVWELPAVLTAAAVVNGISAWLRTEVSDRAISLTGQSGAQPARGMVLQAVIAAALLAAVLWLVRRADHRVIDVDDRAKGNSLPVIAAIGTTCLALLLGLGLRNAVLGETDSVTSNGATVAIPATWRTSTSTTELTATTDGAGGGRTSMTLRSIAIDPSLTDEEAIAIVSGQLNVERGTERSGYKVFDLDGGRTLKGKASATARYAYTVDESSFLQESLPVVMTGDDTYVRNGAMVHVLTVDTPVGNRSAALPRYRRFVSSLKFTGQ